MILYQLVQWMDERAMLAGAIRESQGDVRFLRFKKEQVEEQMRINLQRWIYGLPERKVLGEPQVEIRRETDIYGLWVIETAEESDCSLQVQ